MSYEPFFRDILTSALGVEEGDVAESVKMTILLESPVKIVLLLIPENVRWEML